MSGVSLPSLTAGKSRLSGPECKLAEVLQSYKCRIPMRQSNIVLTVWTLCSEPLNFMCCCSEISEDILREKHLGLCSRGSRKMLHISLLIHHAFVITDWLFRVNPVHKHSMIRLQQRRLQVHDHTSRTVTPV